MLHVLPCHDSPALAEEWKKTLAISAVRATELGREALAASRSGRYRDSAGRSVDWRPLVAAAIDAKRSIPPDAPLPPGDSASHAVTHVQVRNETTLAAARRLVDHGSRPLALNFANGVNPGGGFLLGATAQEEALCRSSALFVTLLDDPMYDAHRDRPLPDSTSWSILSPRVPVFRDDDGTPLSKPWLLCFLTCAAPYAPALDAELARRLLRERIHRVLAIARSHGYSELVLGAWGCGAFRNDPWQTASDFRAALVGEFAGAFSQVVFAITDWSPERRFLGPFCEVFAPEA